jgi:O-antigen/teichoic acid export membrane protein
MSFWRRGLGRSLVMMAQAVFTRGIGLISTALLARLLTPTDWGSVQAVLQTAGTMTQTLKLSVDTGLQIRLSETARRPTDPTDEEFLGAGLVLVAAVSAVGLFLGLVLDKATAELFGQAELAPYMGWAGWLAAGQLIAQVGAVLLAFGAVRALAIAYVGMNSAYLALVVAGSIMHVPGLLLGLGTQLFLQLGLGLTLLGMAVHAWRARAKVPRLSRLWTAQRQLLRIGLPVHAAGSVPALVGLFVSANLARTSGISGLAELRVVGSMNQLVAIVPGSMAVAFLSEFAGARGNAEQVLGRDFLRYIRMIVANAIIAATTLAWTANWLVPLAFGSTYLSAVKLTSLGVATTVVMVTKQAILTGLMSERKTGYALLDSLLSSVLFALLAVWLQPDLGVAGMLLAELIGHLTVLILFASLLTGRFVQAETRVPAIKAASALMLTITALLFSFSTHDEAWGPWLYTPILICLSASVPWVLFTRNERTIIAQMLIARWRRIVGYERSTEN